MGRVVSEAPVSGGGVGSLANPIFNIRNRGGIAANDLVTLFENGTVVKTSIASSLAVENNTTNGPSLVKASAAVTGNNYRHTAYAEQTAWLDSGNYVLAYSGNGTTNSTGVRFQIRNKLGNNAAAEVIVSAVAGIGTIRVARLNSTKFVIAWTEGTAFKFAIYNNDGTVAVAGATIATLANTNVESNGMEILLSGDIVFAYQKVTSTDLAFKRYNNSGVLQGAETTVEAASAGTHVAVKALSSGNFIIYYYRSAATTGYKFAQYTSLGVIVGALTALGTFATAEHTVGKQKGTITELSNGNIVMASVSPSNTDASLYIYTSANAFVTRLDMLSTFNNGSNRPQLVSFSGGFACAGVQTANGVTMMSFDNAGGTLAPQTVVTSLTSGATGSGSNVDLYSIGIGFVIATSQTNGASYVVNITEVDTLLAAKGTPVTVEAYSATLVSYLSSAMSPDFLLAFQYTSGATTIVKSGLYKVLRSSIFGVASAAAADGALVSIGTIGSYQINQNVSAGGAFNQNAATIAGNRGLVAGNSVLLYGLSA